VRGVIPEKIEIYFLQEKAVEATKQNKKRREKNLGPRSRKACATASALPFCLQEEPDEHGHGKWEGTALLQSVAEIGTQSAINPRKMKSRDFSIYMTRTWYDALLYRRLRKYGYGYK
jgi:hypothetical protein